MLLQLQATALESTSDRHLLRVGQLEHRRSHSPPNLSKQLLPVFAESLRFVRRSGPRHRIAHRIETPCLVIHSDADFRCPIEQAEQLFAVLLDNGVEVELLRFPAEGHELSRSGAPVHRRERFEAILDWHDRHLRFGG